MLTINVEEMNRVVIVGVVGELSFAYVEEFEDVFKKYLHSKLEVIALDLIGMPYLDSFGISRIIKISRKFSAVGVEFVLINMNESISQILKIATFDRILNIMDEEEFILTYIPSGRFAGNSYTETINGGVVPLRRSKQMEIKHVEIVDNTGVTVLIMDK